MIVLMVGVSIAMRWSQKRGVRKRAAAEARRYAKYLRERESELAGPGSSSAGRSRVCIRSPARLWTLLVKRQTRLGAPPRPQATSCTCASARAACRSTARSSSTWA